MKRDKSEACRAFYLFCNEFNKFKNKGARILDSIYYRTSKLLKNCIWRENVKILQSFMQCYNGRHYVT